MDYSSFSNPSSNSWDSTSMAGKNKQQQQKKKGVKLSTDPQSVAARQRRHRISDRFKILQSMVPGGSKMDTVSMLEQAIQYVKFLKTQIWLHQAMITYVDTNSSSAAAAAVAPPTVYYSAAALPFNDHRHFDFCDDRYSPAHCDHFGCLPECSWFSGEENWGFDASMHT